MVTITEDYVSFEIAKLLKEKGFDIPYYYCSCVYSDNGTLQGINSVRFKGVKYLSAPTLQMAMKWLREIHNIAIDTEWEHSWYAYVKPMTANPSEDDYYQNISVKYEEAVEAAIMYCLENLI